METEIGPTLRETRIRRRIDLTEVEDWTKIRVRYLRALENEEWDLLPGPTYTRSFIRTYANYLGLDGDRLADEFRHVHEMQRAEHPGHEPHVLPSRAVGAARRGRPRISAGMVAAIAAAVLVAVIAVLGVTSNSGKRNHPSGNAAKGGGRVGKRHAGGGRPPGVSVQLTATADVWVCAIAADGTRVVNGQILTTGTQRGPYRSRKFDVAFGNGSIEMKVDGKPVQVRSTPSPVGYEVTAGKVRLLAPGTRPDCSGTGA